MQRHTGISGRGFTLIELLVVIAIIAILAAILFPVFARARENARRSSCMSNLKQISLGIFQYTQDYDEKFPIHNDSSKTPGGYGGWSVLLDPYLKSKQILQCPSDSTLAPTTPNQGGYTDYAINLTLSYDGAAARGLSLAALTYPSLTVALCEDFDPNASTSPASLGFFWSAGNAAVTNGTTVAAGFATFRGTAPNSGAAQRHLDGANFAFTDGHVKWYRGSSSTRSAAVYNWNTPLSTSGNSPTFNPSP